MSLVDFADVLQQQNVGVHGFTASDLFSQLHELQMVRLLKIYFFYFIFKPNFLDFRKTKCG